MKKILLIMCCLIASTAEASNKTQTHIWDKTPIRLTLNVDQERRLEFPAGVVDIKVKGSVNEASRIMTVPGDERVYWTAKKPFKKTRVIVVTTSGYHYYLDINAVKVGGNDVPMIIKHKQEPDKDSAAQASIDYDYADLVRYAAQHFHGPARLIEPLYGMSRQTLNYRQLPHLIRGASFEARPVIQWRSTRPPLYVTAVEIVNKTTLQAELLPTMVRGNFLFAAQHNSVLMPKGKLGDTSVLYLISKGPFKQVAGVTHE